MARFPIPLLRVHALTKYVLELFVIGGIYFALAKLDLALAAIHPSAISIAPAPGFALGAILLRGLRVWPAILVAAMAAHAPSAIADATLMEWTLALLIATGEAAVAVIAGYLINIWSDGRRVLESTAGTVKFAMISVGPSAMLGATVGVVAPYLIGSVGSSDSIGLWIEWWLRTATGLLVIAPAIVVWMSDDFTAFNHEKRKNWALSGIVLFAVGILGFLAFSPLLSLPVNRTTLSMLAVFPVVWAALRCSQRETVICTATLSAFAIWGAWPSNGSFGIIPNEPFLISSITVISASVLGLIISADIGQRQRLKTKLFRQEQNLRALLSHADLGIAQIDTTGQFRLVNSCYCEIVHRSAEELLKLRLQDLLQADAVSQMTDLVGKAVRIGKSFVVESKTVLPAGTQLWIRSNVSPLVDQTNAIRSLAVITEDITARREAEDNLARERQKLLDTIQERTASLTKTRAAFDAEVEQRKLVEDALRSDFAEARKTREALVESEWRFQTVIQGITDYAIFMLDRDGCITNWNVGAQRIHQYAAEEVIGRHFSRFYSDEEQQAGEPARTLQVAAYEG